ncbi:MAG: hypothetical protein AABY68_06660 [Pseudomonadota bacterium]
MIEVPKIDMSEWVAELKPYQSSSINQLLAEHSEEETIKLWLSANGPTANIPFGGANLPSSEPFFDRFKNEFRKFVCGDPAYEKFREQLLAQTPMAKSIYISAISAALGATLGYAATLLAPAVAIMLHLVGTMGINAWCNAS